MGNYIHIEFAEQLPHRRSKQMPVIIIKTLQTLYLQFYVLPLLAKQTIFHHSNVTSVVVLKIILIFCTALFSQINVTLLK